ncbi:hypothetical protein Ppro_2820 [Pelobacter propionicus DSM 2379]|uniref:Uncharacterized protein n=1 Tax=Pelobacter propionicus (strain DSM 2379 / NBRC 103807 / OttBd1) TaxID=338966 RepID=A1ASU8_PELPD|nr:hypothetical protein Ppro_2820 [Pelobacter propionicus DSM 2379]
MRQNNLKKSPEPICRKARNSPPSRTTKKIIFIQNQFDNEQSLSYSPPHETHRSPLASNESGYTLTQTMHPSHTHCTFRDTSQPDKEDI